MPENNLSSRLKNAWNAFMNRDPPLGQSMIYGGYSYNPYRMRYSHGNERSIVAPIFTKIAMDCASIRLQHVRIDENGNYVETINSKLNRCLSLNANKDQTARDFIQDAVMSMFDEGCIGLPPIDTITRRTKDGLQYDIESIRTGRIIQWYPDYIKMMVYNDADGQTRELLMPKSAVPILQNPLYAVMNENNSIVQRLVRTLNLSDTLDNQVGSGKLNMLVQLPYSTRTESLKTRANERRLELEQQLTQSKYGIGYIDSTEKVTQLNRGLENNLYDRVKYLTEQLYSQLGITDEILNGTANETTMQNYYSRTIEPVVSVIVDNMSWKYLTQAARDRGETIMIFRDPFKLVPVASMADIADKFTRNEILSPNEVRQIVGRKPVADDKANELRNRNINSGADQNFAIARTEDENLSNQNNSASEQDDEKKSEE